MEFVTIFVIAVSLAMDAFAVSVAKGTTYRNLSVFRVLLMAGFFGVFQGIMPLFGHLLQGAFRAYIEDFDHWIAFLLLSGIGLKMMHDAKKHATEEQRDPTRLWVLVLLSVATSVDALAVGFTLSLLTSYIYVSVLIIGTVTFVLSLAGYEAGKKVGHVFENKIEVGAGVVLIGIGVKILLQHLFF